MRVRRGLVALTSVLLVALPVAPAQAVNSLAFAMVVLCDDPDGTSTDEIVPGLGLAGGTYAVTVTGACIFDLWGQSVGTPCSGPVGPMPCVSVNNLPAFCRVAIGTWSTNTCPEPEVLFCGQLAYFVVDDQCLQTPVAGTISHPTAGPLRARFADSDHSDNRGAFVVTVVWTPL